MFAAYISVLKRNGVIPTSQSFTLDRGNSNTLVGGPKTSTSKTFYFSSAHVLNQLPVGNFADSEKS